MKPSSNFRYVFLMPSWCEDLAFYVPCSVHLSSMCQVSSLEELISELKSKHLSFVAKTVKNGVRSEYFQAVLLNQNKVLGELTVEEGPEASSEVFITLKSGYRTDVDILKTILDR